MQLTAITKNIEVVPSICKDSEEKFKLLFRYPNQADLIRIMSNQNKADAIADLQSLFVGFENKPEIQDEDGKPIEYETFADMMDMSGVAFTSILNDVVLRFDELKEDAGRLEKKS